jgi:hypothetical protein
MPPQKPKRPQPENHEPQAFESDLDRHRGSDDEVYGAHGVQPEPDPAAVRPSSGRGSRGLTRVGDRRRH